MNDSFPVVLTQQERAEVEEALHATQPREPLARTMRTLPEAMDRQAYLTLDQHAKSLQLRLIVREQFIKAMNLEGEFMQWCQKTENLP